MVNLLPIGTVVQLTGKEFPTMIVGYGIESRVTPGAFYDYAGFPYPMGFTSTYDEELFSTPDIEKIIVMGFQDEESLDFLTKLNKALIENSERKE